jgi:hypothetical protein
MTKLTYMKMKRPASVALCGLDSQSHYRQHEVKTQINETIGFMVGGNAGVDLLRMVCTVRGLL